MNNDEDFMRQIRMARLMGDTSDQAKPEDDGSSVEDMRLARRLAALQDAGEDDSPVQDDALVSEGTKQAFKKAGALAAIAGRWGASKAKEGALLAAEKMRAAKETTDKALAEREARNAMEEALAVAEQLREARAATDKALADRDARRKEQQTAAAPYEPFYQEEEQAPAPKVQKPDMSMTGKILVLVLGSLVFLVGFGGLAYWLSKDKSDAVAVVPVAKSAPVALPAIPVAVAEPVAIEQVPIEPEVVEAEPVHVVTPETVVLAKPTPKPVVASVKKKAAPAPVKEEWQDKAQQDMDQFEKQLGNE